MIKVNNVSKFYNLTRKQKQEMGSNFSDKSILAVNDICFLANQVEFGLIGPNGAGKTSKT